MPTEEHQRRRTVGPADIVDLLCSVLDGPSIDRADVVSLAEAGVPEDSLADLWDTVCEEFAEHGLGTEIEPGSLDPSMTLEQAATVMAKLLQASAGDGG